MHRRRCAGVSAACMCNGGERVRLTLLHMFHWHSELLTSAVAQQAARRRQQPKRGCSALAAPADEADASQSTGSAKRHQLSSPSDGQQRTPSPAEPQPGPRLLRSTSRAAACAPVSARGANTSSAAKPGRQPGGDPLSNADSVAGAHFSPAHSAPHHQACVCGLGGSFYPHAPHSRGHQTMK